MLRGSELGRRWNELGRGQQRLKGAPVGRVDLVRGAGASSYVLGRHQHVSGVEDEVQLVAEALLEPSPPGLVMLRRVDAPGTCLASKLLQLDI